MAEQKIEFRRIRDVGACISDTFVFIRQHAAPLLKSLFAICTVFLLVQAIFAGFYSSGSTNLFSSMIQQGRDGNGFPNLGMVGSVIVILGGLSLLMIVSVQVTLGVYIKFYVENKESPGIAEVWTLFKRYFLRVCLFQIPLYLSIFVGIIFCILPGIYLSIVLMPFNLVVIMEDKDFIPAYRRCFELVRDNFWTCVGVSFIASLIYTMGSIFMGIVLAGVGKLISYLTTSETTVTMEVVTSFLNTFSFLFYIFYFVSIALNYFSLVEKKDGVGLISRIDDISNNQDIVNDAGEQY